MRSSRIATAALPVVASRATQSIPVFSLFGEADSVSPDFIHIEDIRSRSERYGWEISGHRHHGLSQILLLIDGTAHLQIDERAEFLSGPFVVLIPSGVVHGFRFTPETQGYVLTIEDSLLSASGRNAASPSAIPAEPVLVDLASATQQLARLVAIFEQIVQECREGGQATAAVLQWLTNVALVLVLRLHESRVREKTHGAGVAADFHRFRAMVERHFMQHWPVPRYADELRISESRLNRVCRIAGGKSALEIVQDRLTLEARRRLVHVAGSVSSIAYELGFEDPAYFWRFFRRRTGVTPRQFRSQQRSES